MLPLRLKTTFKGFSLRVKDGEMHESTVSIRVTGGSGSTKSPCRRWKSITKRTETADTTASGIQIAGEFLERVVVSAGI